VTGPAATAARGRRRKALLRIALSALVLWIVFRYVGDARVVDALRSAQLLPWCLTLLLFFAIHVASAMKWRLFLRLSGGELGIRDTLRCYFAGLFANNYLPSMIGGDVLRAALAMAVEPRGREIVVVGGVADRFGDLAALGILAAAGLLATPAAMATRGAAPVSGWLAIGVLFGGLLLLVAGVWLLLRTAARRRLPRRPRRVLLRMLRALSAWRKSAGMAVGGMASCLAIQASLILLNVYLAGSIGMTMDLRLWLFLWPLTKIVAMLPVSMGGLGVREAAFAVLAQPFAIDPHLAVAQSLLWQSVLIAGGLLGGGVWLLLKSPGELERAQERHAS
jgi:uncharacterized protein (TIRG00374 family)